MLGSRGGGGGVDRRFGRLEAELTDEVVTLVDLDRLLVVGGGGGGDLVVVAAVEVEQPVPSRSLLFGRLESEKCRCVCLSSLVSMNININKQFKLIVANILPFSDWLNNFLVVLIVVIGWEV